MGALLDDLAFPHHQYDVGVPYRGQPMGDDERYATSAARSMSELFNHLNGICWFEQPMSKMIPAAVRDFQTLANGDYHFVDKSLMIKDIVELGKGAFLFTRPRRFGKTMNLSMLEAFFDKDTLDGDRLFSGLKISEFSDVMEHRGKYKVIRLNFADIESFDQAIFLERFSIMMSKIYVRFSRVLECDGVLDDEREQFKAIRSGRANWGLLLDSVSLLSRWVKIAYGTDVVILIDEYDKPVHAAYLKGFYTEFMDFFAPFMESTLKSNPDFSFAVVTGVSRISKETVFSGLNNMREFDIFKSNCDESFGFTEEEVGALISEIGLPSEELDTMRKHYDGYHFGNEDVYNPFCVMSYIQDRLSGQTGTDSYWAQSGDTMMISDVLSRTEPSFRDRILTLAIPGNYLKCKINPRLTIRKLQSMDEAVLEESTITLMVTSGYLKAIPCDDGDYIITIPNMEVFDGYEELVSDMGISDITSASRLSEFMFRKDAVKATEELNKIMDGQAPRDHYDEKVHKFFLSLLFGFSGYRYQTELGSGDGYVDLYIKGAKSRPGLLMELKYSDEKCDMSKLADSALKQISEKEYSRNIDETHIIVGIGYHKHSAKVVFGDTVVVPPKA